MSRHNHGKAVRGGVLQVDLCCSECGKLNPIVRRRVRTQSRGHPKHLYCPWCKVETLHIQVTDHKGVTA